jgi:hypothetical protein
MRVDAMRVDDLTRDAADRLQGALRPALESGLKGLAEALARDLADEHAAALEAALREARRVADAELAEASADADRQLADVQEELTARIADLERQLVAVREKAEGEARATQFEVEKEHQADMSAAIEAARRDARGGAVIEARRLLDSIRTLDGATALSDALQRLAECAHREADRAAVLVMKEQRLQGWAFHGFDSSAATPTGVSLAPADGGLVGHVCATAAPMSTDRSGLALPAFAGDGAGRHAVAVPVLVGGTVVAVLYADAPRAAEGDDVTWPTVLEVLARHASRLIEAIMVAQASGVRIPRPGA